MLPRPQLLHPEVLPQLQGYVQAEGPAAQPPEQHDHREGDPGDGQSEAEAGSDQSDVPLSPPNWQAVGHSDRRAESSQFPIIVFRLHLRFTSQFKIRSSHYFQKHERHREPDQ